LPITLSPLEQPLIADQPVEIVERKGLGHPDSICDALAEDLSLALCRRYRETCGLVMHHNVDKVLLSAGTAEPAFGGGRVVKPIEIFLSGRATTACDGAEIPLARLIEDSAGAWLRRHFHALDPETDVKLHALVRPGSPELVELFRRSQRDGVWLANDTSCGVGYAPLTSLEQVVLAVEQALTDASLHDSEPAFGEDVKVMGLRRGRRIELTVACALIGRHLHNVDDYLAAKERIAGLARETAAELTDMPLDIMVNTADDPATENLYLTVTGTSAEGGDDGEAGRGNRVNGLITPYRPMTMESVAGKNPLTHVGKLYNLAAGLIAERLVAEVPNLLAANCFLLSRIGQRIDRPQIVDLRVASTGTALAKLRPALEAIVQDELRKLPELVDQLLDGRLGLDRWPLRGGA
jgi:S-adenosylmethionine synthetase